jgi:hypothetical protein
VLEFVSKHKQLADARPIVPHIVAATDEVKEARSSDLNRVVRRM